MSDREKLMALLAKMTPEERAALFATPLHPTLRELHEGALEGCYSGEYGQDDGDSENRMETEE